MRGLRASRQNSNTQRVLEALWTLTDDMVSKFPGSYGFEPPTVKPDPVFDIHSP